MEHTFYQNLNFAKRSVGFYLDTVNKGRHFRCIAVNNILQKELSQLISDLITSSQFFKEIGKKYEVDILIVYYSSLLGRVNSILTGRQCMRIN